MLNFIHPYFVAFQSTPSGVDFTAITGILGTLLGAALGAFVTWKIQRDQLARQDRTRFHDRRLSVYTDFNYTCNHIFGALGSHQLASATDIDKLLQTFEILRLIASDHVAKTATVVFNTATHAIQANVPAAQEQVDIFNQQMATLVIAIRNEVGLGTSN